MSKFLPYIVKLLSKLPLPVLYVLSWIVYVLLFYIFGARKQLTLQNLKESFTKQSESERLLIAKNHYKSVCMVVAETIKAISLSKEEIKGRVKFTNLNLLEKYLNNNQSVIIVTAHFCNIEWALYSCAQHINYPVDTIYRTQKVSWLEKLFFELRSQFGITPLPMETCISESVKRAKITRMIAMAADQSPKKDDTPYWHTFLNRDTAFHTGTEKIAKAFKYPILFMSMKRTHKGYYEASLKLIAEPPFTMQPNEIMRRYIMELETLVTESPKDWLWAYRRWKIAKPVYD